MTEGFENENFDDVWEDDTTKPKSNWFEFGKVGDSISGALVESFDKEGNFGLQRIYVVKAKNNEEYNVALKHTTHKVQIQQLKKAEIGDIVAFRLKELVDTGKGNPAKSIEVRIRHRTPGESNNVN